MTLPSPLMRKISSRSATTRSASSLRRKRSVRQSFANSTHAFVRLAGNRSSFSSSFSNNVKASATAPANPARIFPSFRTRTFWAESFTTVSPMVTWPSPASAVRPAFLTATTVVARVSRRFIRLLRRTGSPPQGRARIDSGAVSGWGALYTRETGRSPGRSRRRHAPVRPAGGRSDRPGEVDLSTCVCRSASSREIRGPGAP